MSDLPADWSDADRRIYAHNVEDRLALGRSEADAHRLAVAMVERMRLPVAYVRLF